MESKFIKEFKYSIFMLIIGIILFFIGFIKEEHYAVFKKSMEICLQFIEIG